MSLADDVLDRAAELRRRGETFVVATVVRVEPPTSAQAGDKALITADGKLWGWVGGSCSEGLVRREAIQRSYALPLPETAIDPICGMQVEVTGAMHTLRVGETIHYFCGAGCLDAFRLREGQSISR